MGIGSIGIPSMILIVIIALLIFGPKKLPEIGKATGETVKEFKNSANDLMSDDEEEQTEETTKENNDVKEDNEAKEE